MSLKALLKYKKHSISWLSKKAGLRYATVHNLCQEKEKYRCRKSTYEKIAKALNCSPDVTYEIITELSTEKTIEIYNKERGYDTKLRDIYSFILDECILDDCITNLSYELINDISDYEDDVINLTIANLLNLKKKLTQKKYKLSLDSCYELIKLYDFCINTLQSKLKEQDDSLYQGECDNIDNNSLDIKCPIELKNYYTNILSDNKDEVKKIISNAKNVNKYKEKKKDFFNKHLLLVELKELQEFFNKENISIEKSYSLYYVFFNEYIDSLEKKISSGQMVFDTKNNCISKPTLDILLEYDLPSDTK